MADAAVIKSFLYSLDFRIDQSSRDQFNRTMNEANARAGGFQKTLTSRRAPSGGSVGPLSHV
jgi:hypothetical protein